MTIYDLKKLVHNTKFVYVFEPVTEGYVRVIKASYILVLDSISSDAEINEDIIDLRNSEDLYIN